MAITKITTPELFNLQSNNTEGTRLPVMTTTQREAMTGMSNGELIFNSTTDSVEYYDLGATAWYKIDYDPIVYPTSLKMFLDASNTTSYPGSGTTWFDLTSNGNNGTISGAYWNPGGYFDFDGSNDGVTTTLGHSDLPVNSSWSCSCWINTDSYSSPTNVFGMEDGSSPYYGWSLYLATNGRIYIMVNGNSTVGYYVVTAGSWNFVTITYNGSLLSLYSDGSFVQSATTSISTPSSNFKLANLGIYSPYDGKISKVRLHDKVLTQGEITILNTEGR